MKCKHLTVMLVIVYRFFKTLFHLKLKLWITVKFSANSSYNFNMSKSTICVTLWLLISKFSSRWLKLRTFWNLIYSCMNVFAHADVGSWIMLGTRNVCVVPRQGLGSILGIGIVPSKSSFSSIMKTPCFPSYLKCIYDSFHHAMST